MVIVLWGLVVFLAAVFILGFVPTALLGEFAVVFLFGLVLLAYFTRFRSRRGAPRLGGGMADPMSGIGIGMTGTADGTSGGGGDGGCSSHITGAHCGGHGGWGDTSGGHFGGGGGS